MTYSTRGVSGRNSGRNADNRFSDRLGSRDFGSSEEGLIDTIRENPISVALIGAGLGLLIAGSINASRSHEDDDSYDYYPSTSPSSGVAGSYSSPYTSSPYTTGAGSRYGSRNASTYGTQYGSRYDTGSGTQYDTQQYGTQRNLRSGGMSSGLSSEGSNMASRAESAGESMRDRTSQLGDQAREQAQRTRESARYEARRARRGLSRAMDENPLAVGAVAALAGAAVGLLIPNTEYENEFMGDTRDTVMNRAQDLAKEAQSAATHVAKDALNTAKEEAQKQGLTVQGLREDLQDKVEKGKQVAQKAAEEAKQTAKGEAQGGKEKAQNAAEDVKQTAKEDANKAQDKAQQAAKDATSQSRGNQSNQNDQKQSGSAQGNQNKSGS